MRLLIIEDEALAAERLKLLVKEYDPNAEVLAMLESVEEAANWLQTHPPPDVLLLDIHLADGHSFELFNRISYNRPVIFTTAYDQYAIEAFRYYSIDYILKPVTLKSLAAALQKLERLSRTNFDYSRLDAKIVEQAGYKDRFLARVGQRLFFIEEADIAYFEADNKIVHLADRQGNKFLVDFTLEKLESSLDPKVFFRLNRRLIVRSSAIEQIKPFAGGRLRLLLKGGVSGEAFTVSRDKVTEFKRWAGA